jgi:hypothetical protein
MQFSELMRRAKWSDETNNAINAKERELWRNLESALKEFHPTERKLQRVKPNVTAWMKDPLKENTKKSETAWGKVDKPMKWQDLALRTALASYASFTQGVQLELETPRFADEEKMKDWVDNFKCHGVLDNPHW